jgi:NTE family protein
LVQAGKSPPAEITAPRAVVLGDGGLVGVAWEIRILKGLRDVGLDLSDADLFVGTAAGAIVASQCDSARA